MFPENAFGDPFDLARLPLPRPARGYGVQLLDTDQLLDKQRGEFLPVRTPGLDALFPSFEAARQAAGHWLHSHDVSADEHRLAIVPTGFDDVLQRPILIYGVLCAQP